MLDMLLLDIFQNLDIWDITILPCYNFIYIRQPVQPIIWFPNRTEPYEAGQCCLKTCEYWLSVWLSLSLLLINGPGLIDRWAWCLVVMEDPETSNNTSLSLVLWGDETHQSGGSVRSCEAGCCLAKFLSRDRLEFLLTISHSATLVSLLSLLLLLLLLLLPLLHPLHQAS